MYRVGYTWGRRHLQRYNVQQYCNLFKEKRKRHESDIIGMYKIYTEYMNQVFMIKSALSLQSRYPSFTTPYAV